MKISKRWMPAVVTPAVIAAISLVPLQASAVDLPDMSAEELMVMMMDAQPDRVLGNNLENQQPWPASFGAELDGVRGGRRAHAREDA
jgi:hypothetical protein